jgi:Mg2+ and Co2+ transporter CorA
VGNQQTREHSERLSQEMRILLEQVQQDVKAVADGVLMVDEKLERYHNEVNAQIKSLDARLMRVESR